MPDAVAQPPAIVRQHYHGSSRKTRYITRAARARQALQVAFTVWNAVIFADVLSDHGYIDQIRHLTAGNPEAGLLVEQMIARKREFFADDERMIGDWEVTRTQDGINVRADARDPYSLPRGILHLAAVPERVPSRMSVAPMPVQILRKHSTGPRAHD